PRRPTSARPAATVPPAQRGTGADASGIDEAMRLADLGLLADATKRCEEHLRAHGPSAQAFYLLGLVHDTPGSAVEAELYYRKALYLDPHHLEALQHLALLREKQGDLTGARLLRSRGQRLQRDKR